MKLVKQYKGKVTFEVNIETLGDPEEVLHKLLDRLGAVVTDDIEVSWDDCDWDLKETCFTCDESGTVYGNNVDGLPILLDCPDCGDE